MFCLNHPVNCNKPKWKKIKTSIHGKIIKTLLKMRMLHNSGGFFLKQNKALKTNNNILFIFLH